MVNFDKSNFNTTQHEKWQERYDQVKDSMAIFHATVAPLTTVQGFLASIPTPPTPPIDIGTSVDDMDCSQPQAQRLSTWQSHWNI